MKLRGKHPRERNINMPRLKAMGDGPALDESRPSPMTCMFIAWREVGARFDAAAETEEVV